MKHNGPYRIDFTGQKFGRLTLLAYTGKMKNGGQLYNCRCDCGAVVVGNLADMKRGVAKSCGCLGKELVSLANKSRSFPPGEAAFRALFRRYKTSAKKRNLDWKLTKRCFNNLVLKRCYYCNAAPNQKCWPSGTKTTGFFVYNGLDRLNPFEGYTIKNTVPCCKHCNVAKLRLNEHDFLSLVSKIYKNNIEKIKCLK